MTEGSRRDEILNSGSSRLGTLRQLLSTVSTSPSSTSPLAMTGEPILLIHAFASNYCVNWVNPRWVETLADAGRRGSPSTTAAMGRAKNCDAPADYRSDLMARYAGDLIAHS